jgi:hypothetical protein
VEEWREANGGFAGRLVLWTKELSTGDEALTHRVYQGVSPLDSTTVRFSPEIRGVTKRWSVSNTIIQYNPHQRAGITDVANIQFQLFGLRTGNELRRWMGTTNQQPI